MLECTSRAAPCPSECRINEYERQIYSAMRRRPHLAACEHDAAREAAGMRTTLIRLRDVPYEEGPGSCPAYENDPVHAGWEEFRGKTVEVLARRIDRSQIDSETLR